MAKLADAYHRVGGTCHGVYAGGLCRKGLCREKLCRRVVSTTTQASTFPRLSHLARCLAYTLPLPTAILLLPKPCLLACAAVVRAGDGTCAAGEGCRSSCRAAAGGAAAQQADDGEGAARHGGGWGLMQDGSRVHTVVLSFIQSKASITVPSHPWKCFWCFAKMCPCEGRNVCVLPWRASDTQIAAMAFL